MRSFRDRDFIQTIEGFLFCVIGNVHPLERIISYLKYIPSTSGFWGKEENKYKRILKSYTIPDLIDTFDYLKKNYPEYFFFSPRDNINLTGVPHSKIKLHFKPEEKLKQIIQSESLDSLQYKLKKFVKLLKQISGISETNFGISGSLLLDIHNVDFSDIDITVYGKDNSCILKNSITKKNTQNPIRKLKGYTLDYWCHKKSKNYPLKPLEILKIYERKWNLGFFENTAFSIHPIKTEKEINEKYGERKYIPCCQTKIRAIVKNNKDSVYLPAVYHLKDVNVIKGPKKPLITEVVSFDSFYASMANVGEKIEIQGKLEKIIEEGKEKQNYRIVVGSIAGKGKEYIKIII
jgi:predicted nucleotidyltransferase